MTSIIDTKESIEAVLLTGGQSRRMGADKATLPVDGAPLAERIANELRVVCGRVTVLGPRPIEGCAFQPDPEEFEGPIVALSRHLPENPLVMVASCDLPLFNASLIQVLANRIGERNAAIPVLEGRLQPLCALYRANALALAAELVQAGERRVMAWIRKLNPVEVGTEEEPAVSRAKNVNTPEELAAALESAWYKSGQDVNEV